MGSRENIEIKDAEYNNIEISTMQMNHRVENIDISFIIPAHNAEATLDKAVYSIVRTIGCARKYEIIIVENSSEDATLAAANDFTKIYPDIVKVAESAPGVSNARNKGLDMAAGKWIVFVDADDELLPEAYRAVAVDLEDGMADLYLHSYKAGKKTIQLCRKEREFYNNAEAVQKARAKMLCQPTHYMTVWSKIFSRNVIKEHHLHFRTDLRLSEDSEFLIRYTKYCSSIQISDIPMYRYTTDSPSAVRTFDGRKTADYMNALRFATADIQEETSEIQRAYAQYVMMQFHLMMVREVFAHENPASFAEKCEMMKKLCKRKIFQRAMAGIPASECTSARLAPVLMLKSGLYPAAGAIYEARVLQNGRKERKKGE